jgi:metal-sulfur cluster biosynthetic enzyme
MTDADAVRDALREVVDSCSAATGSNLDIVEMGLLKSVSVDDGHVDIEMRLTTPVCHMVAYFHKEIDDRVGGLDGVESVEVETDNGFEWSEEMLTPEAKQQRQKVMDEHRARYEAEMAADNAEVDAVSDD